MNEDKIIVNFKANPILKEAIRTVAFNQGHSNNSKTIVQILESNDLISKELKKLKQRSKNKVVVN